MVVQSIIEGIAYQRWSWYLILITLYSSYITLFAIITTLLSESFVKFRYALYFSSLSYLYCQMIKSLYSTTELPTR